MHKLNFWCRVPAGGTRRVFRQAKAGLMAVLAGVVFGEAAEVKGTARAVEAPDPVKALVAQLALDKYQATIKALTQFGDRREGTERNRAAVDWIEAQLRSYGYATERIKYDYFPTDPRRPSGPVVGPGVAEGGGKIRGQRTRLGVNTDPLKQPDEKLRALNKPGSVPGAREEIFCTKVGTTHPEEMYIIAAHLDGIGWGEAANDDGSGTALVMEIARILGAPGVQSERTIRFCLWNNEETGLQGARAYVDQRAAGQGREVPAGSGKYPEPRWLGMIQHDMLLFDHGMPRPDGTMNPEQRPEADVNVEFQSTAKMADGAMKLAWFFQAANEKYATDYPVTVGPHMTNTDSTPFMDLVPAISLRENERGLHIGAGWDPQWHQPTDVYAAYSEKDFLLGLNAAQTTLSAIALLAGVSVE